MPSSKTDPIVGPIERLVAAHPAASSSLAIGAKGFRPFFLLAAAFATVIVPIWLLILGGEARPSAYLPPAIWHAHEMVFGFTVAVIAGFLLTAVGNWTGRETLVGAPLLGLAALWVLGRIGMALAGRVPPALTAVVDLAFLPALAAALGRPLFATRDRHNFVMLATLGALFLANAVVHLDALHGLPAGSARRACLVSIDLVVLMILIIAGRVFPMFTRNATGDDTVRASPRLDLAVILAMIALLVADACVPESEVAVVASAIVGVLAAARAWGWRARRVVRHPLLWILHAGYAWIPIGLLLRLSAHLDASVPASLATHAWTVGAIGSLTLGMMSRVALGHTGRPLVAPKAMAWAFLAMTAAAVVRVAAPMVFPMDYFVELLIAGGLWTAAFLVYLVTYAPILTGPRTDGKPG